MLDTSLYTIGWICALDIEYAAALSFLDEEHDDTQNASAPGERNSYTFGRIGQHNVVVAVLPMNENGESAAATVAAHMVRTFENLRVGLMVGIGGGAPTEQRDIRLGDVVVSAPSGGKGGVYQYDYGKAVQEKKFHQTGHLDAPPFTVRTAVIKLQGRILVKGNRINEDIQTILSKNPDLRQAGFARPDNATDQLYDSNFIHLEGRKDCEACSKSPGKIVGRKERTVSRNDPVIHYGLVASANRVVKDAILRNTFANESGVLCFEMEAAGLMNQFPFLVIRGISDYADTHKIDNAWRNYAAMTAAAYAKRLLNSLVPNEVTREQPIRNMLQDIEDKVDRMCETSQMIHATVKENDVKAWLSAPDPWTDHKAAKDLRLSETGLWCLESTQHREWKAKKSSILWLHGMVGCGKTVLSSTIIEDLKTSGNTVLFFYFDSRVPEKQSFDNMLRSLVWQLYVQEEKTQRILNDIYSTRHSGTVPDWKVTLGAMIDETNHVTIVLDTLDECASTDREKLLLLLEGLGASEAPGSFNMLLTNRDLDELNSSLTEWVPPASDIAIRQKAVDEDIRLYIRARLKTDRVLCQWAKMHNEIEMKLMEKADGMFRWAACQLDQLSLCLDRPNLEKTLMSLPNTLNETYERILKGIPSEWKQQAIRLLQFLTYAKRPLKMLEAIEVIAVMPESTPAFKKENRVKKADWIARYCSSLTRIATATYSPSPGEYKTTQKLYPLLRYAATTWREHARLAGEQQNALSWIMKLFETEKAYNYWLSSPNYDRDIGTFERSKHDPLFYASKLGLVKIVEQLIHDGAPLIDSRNPSEQHCALVVACREGHSEIIEILLEKYEELNAGIREAHIEHAVRSAAWEGNQDLVAKLLKVYTGSNNVIPESRGRHALPNASYQGHEGIVKMLLEQGADANAQDGWRYAIQAAAFGGNKKILQLLIDHGARVDARYDADDDEDDFEYICDEERRTALQLASAEGYDRVVALLLEKGADANARAGPHGTALFAAAFEGHENIVTQAVYRSGIKYGPQLVVP